MAIKLSAVGVFYRPTPIQISGKPTVKDVMDAATQIQGDVLFRYSKVNAGKVTIVNSITAHHTKPFTGRTGKHYPAGHYTLAQSGDFSVNPYVVWQFYVIGRDGKSVTITADPSFTTFHVEDGSQIIWRLVTILSGPKSVGRRFESLVDTPMS